MRILLIYLSLVLLTALCGCKLPRPNIHQPGPEKVQRYEATQFDPYGDTDAGPEIVGGRPRDFQRPFSEPERARTFENNRWPF